MFPALTSTIYLLAGKENFAEAKLIAKQVPTHWKQQDLNYANGSEKNNICFGQTDNFKILDWPQLSYLSLKIIVTLSNLYLYCSK